MFTADVQIPADGVQLDGTLTLPHDALGLVIFAHGSGSSRFSPRNRYVASVLQQRGLGTLLFDLLTREEEAVDVQTRHLRFDIDMLARRLAMVTDWAAEQEETRSYSVGYFGSSTGGAGALIASVLRPDRCAAVVSRGGRADLAGDALPRVTAPTLLIVGGADDVVLDLNRQAMAQMSATVELKVIEGATHLFEEPGALEEVAGVAADWFAQHLAGTGMARETPGEAVRRTPT